MEDREAAKEMFLQVSEGITGRDAHSTARSYRADECSLPHAVCNSDPTHILSLSLSLSLSPPTLCRTHTHTCTYTHGHGLVSWMGMSE
jgi:hypothetical protein